MQGLSGLGSICKSSGYTSREWASQNCRACHNASLLVPLSLPETYGREAHFCQIILRREEIADCSERAYSSLSMADAKKLMMFSSDKEALSYAQEVSRASCTCFAVCQSMTLSWSH